MRSFLDKLALTDQSELEEILQIIQDSKDSGETCELFYPKEAPHVEGWISHLQDLGYKSEFKKGPFSEYVGYNLDYWLVSWEEK